MLEQSGSHRTKLVVVTVVVKFIASVVVAVEVLSVERLPYSMTRRA